MANAFSLAIVIEAVDFFFSSLAGLVGLAGPEDPALGFTPKVGILEGFFGASLGAALLFDAAALLDVATVPDVA